MDQNSSNGTGTDKRNWRERLGIGAKDMPKLTDEFKSAPVAQAVQPVQAQPVIAVAKPAPRAPQPVTKTAPMAPRAAAPKAPAPADIPLPAARPRLTEPATQDALAEKLRAQRAAAEKLAEQRVQAARERAEAKVSTAVEPVLPMPPPRTAPPPVATPTPAATVRPAPVTPPPARPKFSFAEEEPRKDIRAPAEPAPPRPPLSAGPTPPLTPPRPALGGERTQPPFLRPAAPLGTRTQAPLRADGQPTYRPIDPATGYAPPPRPQTPAGGRVYGTEAPPYGTRLPVRRPSSVDPYTRPPEARSYPGEEDHEDPRGNPRLTRTAPPRNRQRPPEDDYDEVFEDEPAPPRQRASAKDYQAVYRETEPPYEEERRRSSGPWLLLLALLAGGIAVAYGVWYYYSKVKPLTATLPSATDTVPVVEAPEVPVKVAPEVPAETPGQAPALKKKQIYDRIVGDQEVSGDQVVPTEEIPVQPALAEPQAAPLESAAPIPSPDAPADAGGVQAPATIDETAPLPLPPPPGNDTQGSLDQSALERTAAAAATPEQGATAPPLPAATAPATDSLSPLPPPEQTADGAATATGEDQSASIAEPEAAPPPVKKKAAPVKQATAAKKKPAAPAPSEPLGDEPVVLVAPGQVAPPSQSEEAISAPVSQQGEAQPVKKKKTLFDLFNGGSSDAGAAAPAPDERTATAPAPAAADETQVASLPETAPAPAPAQVAPQETTSGGPGYVVQLASFRSEAEAQSEFSRLRSSYPEVVGGLSSRIIQASIGGSTRYRLGLGPVASRDKATQVCNSLFSAGERDCLVRSQ